MCQWQQVAGTDGGVCTQVTTAPECSSFDDAGSCPAGMCQWQQVAGTDGGVCTQVINMRPPCDTLTQDTCLDHCVWQDEIAATSTSPVVTAHCREMSHIEGIERSWNEFFAKAVESYGQDASKLTVSREVTENYFNGEDPWEKERVMSGLFAMIDANADGVSKEEFVKYQLYLAKTNGWTPGEQTPTQPKMCVPALTKWQSDAEEQTAFDDCGAIVAAADCVAPCQPFEPEFSAHKEWDDLVQAGLNSQLLPTTFDMNNGAVPKDVYITLAKQAWPEHETKLDGWAADYTDATGKAADLVSRDDFVTFRNYIHKVKEYGCVSGFAQFVSKELDNKIQFAENEACRALDTEVLCVAPCKYQGPYPTTTSPPPTEPCTLFTDAASCPADKCQW
jgi:hypothetical protein